MSQWALDERLLSDTFRIGSLNVCDVLLMDDARWPWLILVPRIDGATEWHDLFTDQRQDIDMEVSYLSGLMKQVTECEKVNIASLGNIVRQLHIHIIARGPGDANWPGPVWGFEQKRPYEQGAAEMLIDNFRQLLELERQ